MSELYQSLAESYPLGRIGLSIGIFLLIYLVRRLSVKVIFRRALVHNFDESRISTVKRIIRIVLNILFVIILGIIWEISLEGLSIYVASIFTVVGVGLFATWSIVSNITASVILFFFFPFRIGSKVKIIDGDNSIEGTVLGLSFFSIQIALEDGTEVYYPNNLAIQKGIKHIKG